MTPCYRLQGVTIPALLVCCEQRGNFSAKRGGGGGVDLREKGTVEREVERKWELKWVKLDKLRVVEEDSKAAAAERKAQKKSGLQASSNPYFSRVLDSARASRRDCAAAAAAPSLILTLSPW